MVPFVCVETCRPLANAAHDTSGRGYKQKKPTREGHIEGLAYSSASVDKPNRSKDINLLPRCHHDENASTVVFQEALGLPEKGGQSEKGHLGTRPDSTYMTTSQLFFRNPGRQSCKPTSREDLLAAPRGRFTAGQHLRKKAVGIVPGLKKELEATPLFYETSYNLTINSFSPLVREAANDIDAARNRYYIGRGPSIKQEATPKTENFIMNETEPKFIPSR
ncbi:unnamed protein product [Schistocephalus solidus]|uniref:Sperm-tail PG-rich repeat-containing protein 2 n=1 Tax=Schistocephalus solidus TaxID=70667 RepID=A0A183TLT0_SCHSO|nr:unnamed protein product [Schistocephalus solidus]